MRYSTRDEALLSIPQHTRTVGSDFPTAARADDTPSVTHTGTMPVAAGERPAMSRRRRRAESRAMAHRMREQEAINDESNGFMTTDAYPRSRGRRPVQIRGFVSDRTKPKEVYIGDQFLTT